MMTLQTPSSPPPPSSSSRKITYDVFLSFRGTDTLTNFTDHLYTALKQKGICTFRDDEELERGELIGPSLFKAIEESRYVVVVFSQHYADSEWCLNEIAKVADCMKPMRLKVLPVFYDVDPSDVRNQKGEYFGKAFENHIRRYEGNPGKLQRWRYALSLVGNLSGWHLQNGSEAKVIQQVVQKIFTELNQIISTPEEGLVGMDSHLEIVLSYLDLGRPDDDVRIIGICGMGGIGKTTIAEVVYERIRPRFEGHCFLKNVREVAKKEGVDRLQEKLLSKLLETDINVEYTKMGKDIILHRLSTKKVLIVFDDMDQDEQLEALCHDRTWFGSGSRIIITSRDEHVLSLSQPDQVYKVNSLSDAEALQLFSLKASKKGDQLDEDFLKLSKEFIKYADGLPLAIKVVGSSLCGRNVGQWSSALGRLKKSPEKQVIGVLKWSFDGLAESEQIIFLDIACFLKGKSLDRVRKILQGSNDHCPDIDLQVLLDKSMITLSGEKLWMHDMMQELGWAIVCQEPEPGRRSRLWRSNEIIQILDRNKATSAVQSISLIGPTKYDIVHSLNDSVSEMDKLRLLKICSVKFSGNIKYLSNELQYLKWHECPLKSFPSNFQPDNLVELKLHSSCIQQLWRGENGWSMLRFIDLRGSKYLRSTPDFTKVPHLEKLNLHDCTSLVNVHPSLGCLKKLDVLDMTNCESVESLPPFTNLESLRYLSLALCSRLKKFPEIEGDMKALLYLSLGWTSVEELPTSVACLTGLTHLYLNNCKNPLRLSSAIRCLKSMVALSLTGCANINELPDDMDFLKSLNISGTAVQDLSFVVGMKGLTHLTCIGCKGLASESGKGLRPLWSLTGLIELDLSYCSLIDVAIPNDLSSLISLTSFKLGGNNFVRLPDSISQLSKLLKLELSNCKQLQFLPRLPSSVEFVTARDCNSLMDFPNQMKRLSGNTVVDSLNSDDSSLVNSLNFDNSLNSDDRQRLSLLKSQLMHHLRKRGGITKLSGDARMEREQRFIGVFPDDEIPEWFSTKSEGNRISIPFPPKLIHDDKWHGVLMCAVFSVNERNRSAISLVDPGSEIPKKLVQCTLTSVYCFKKSVIFVGGDEERIRPFSHQISVFYIPKWEFSKISVSDTISATFETSHTTILEIQKCGVHLVYEQDVGWYDKLFPQMKCTHLNEVHRATQNSGWISRVDTFWKWEPCTLPEKEDSTTILQRKNMESVLPRYLEAENSAVLFLFNLRGYPGWCMEDLYSSSSPVSYRLPSNLYRCKKWMGIAVYASIAEKEPPTYRVSLELNIGGYYMKNSITTIRSSEEPHLLLFVFIPRAAIIQEFTQTSQTILRMAFSTVRLGSEFQFGGFKIVNQQEGLEEFAEAILNCMERAHCIALNNKWVVERWIELLRMKGDSCTPNKRFSITRRERKFELLSQKYRTRLVCVGIFFFLLWS